MLMKPVDIRDAYRKVDEATIFSESELFALLDTETANSLADGLISHTEAWLSLASHPEVRAAFTYADVIEEEV